MNNQVPLTTIEDFESKYPVGRRLEDSTQLEIVIAELIKTPQSKQDIVKLMGIIARRGYISRLTSPVLGLLFQTYARLANKGDALEVYFEKGDQVASIKLFRSEHDGQISSLTGKATKILMNSRGVEDLTHSYAGIMPQQLMTIATILASNPDISIVDFSLGKSNLYQLHASAPLDTPSPDEQPGDVTPPIES